LGKEDTVTFHKSFASGLGRSENFDSRVASPHCSLLTIAIATPLVAVACSDLELFIADGVTD